MMAGFVAGAGGAIGTYHGEEMATMEAFILAATVVGFVDGTRGTIGTCKDEEMTT